jgi:hypothetical protein
MNNAITRPAKFRARFGAFLGASLRASAAPIGRTRSVSSAPGLCSLYLKRSSIRTCVFAHNLQGDDSLQAWRYQRDSVADPITSPLATSGDGAGKQAAIRRRRGVPHLIWPRDSSRQGRR